MGMIFNSAETLLVVDGFNTRYNKANIAAHRDADAAILAGSGSSHDKSKRIGVTTPIHAGEGKSRWQHWLDNMDGIKDPQTQTYFGQLIQKYLSMFLKDKPYCQAIEFYLVEANAPAVFAIPPAPPQDGSSYFGVITVQTPVWNSVTLQLRADLDRPAKGRRKAAESPGVRVPANQRRSPKTPKE